jgi:hypothetical protein
VFSSKFRPGRTIRFTSLGSSAFASSSPQTRWRPPVRVLMTTSGWRRANAWPMSVTGAMPDRSNACGTSRPGIFVISVEPGLKPSLRLWSVGSIGFCARLRGIDSRLRLSRLRVSLAPSARVK